MSRTTSQNQPPTDRQDPLKVDCIRVAIRPGTKLHEVGPAIFVPGSGGMRAVFHPSFRPTLCASGLSVKHAIARWKRKLSLDQVVDLTADEPPRHEDTKGEG